MEKKILLILTLLGLISVLFCIIPGRGTYTETPEEEVHMIHLNDSITNSMSMIPELEGLDKKVEKYMRRWQIKGASLAITRGDSLVYAKGYG